MQDRGNIAALGSGTGSLTASGLLDLNGFSLSVGAFSGSGTIDNVTAGGGVTLTVGSGGGSGVFSGTLQNTTGTIALVKAGNGTQTLSGANTYLGTTTVNGGTLLAANTAALPSWQNAGTITVGAARGARWPFKAGRRRENSRRRISARF